MWHRGVLEDLQHPAAVRLLCTGGALVAAGFLLALSLRVAELPSWGAGGPPMRGVSARWHGDDEALARSTAIHNRAVQLHAGVLAGFASSGRTDVDLLNLWDLFGPTFPCAEKERFGEWADGGKWVCSAYEVLGQQPCVVFSLGSNGVTGFETEIRSQYPHCAIHVYDPTITDDTAALVAVRTNATVHRIWIADEGYYGRQAAVNQAENITTIRREMEALGTPWLNILKMDIEGSEWETFEDLFAAATMPFAEILVELHVGKLPARWGIGFHDKLSYFFDGLARHGYRVANNEINLRCNDGTLTARCLDYIEYTLVKTDEQGHVIAGPPQ